VDGKDTFDALAEAHLTHRDGLTEASILPRNHGTFERLQPLFVAFLNANMDTNGIPRPELRMSFSTGVLVNEIANKSVLHG
jgi:phage tail protein X